MLRIYLNLDKKYVNEISIIKTNLKLIMNNADKISIIENYASVIIFNKIKKHSTIYMCFNLSKKIKKSGLFRKEALI